MRCHFLTLTSVFLFPSPTFVELVEITCLLQFRVKNKKLIFNSLRILSLCTLVLCYCVITCTPVWLVTGQEVGGVKILSEVSGTKQ